MESSGRITSEEIAHCSRRVDRLCVLHLLKRVHGFDHRAISRLERCHNNGRFPLCRFGRYCFSPRGWPAIHNLPQIERRLRAVVFAQAVTSRGISQFADRNRFGHPWACLPLVQFRLNSRQFHCAKRRENEIARSGKRFAASLPPIAVYS
jgi:hypothetical protein